MLVLSRKQDQEIHVPEYGIKFQVLRVEGNRVRIGIDAPPDVRIIRNELRAGDGQKPIRKAARNNCLDPNYVWPLGVRFVAERAGACRKNRIIDRYPKHLEAANSAHA